MHDHDKQDGMTGQGGMNAETEQRNRENETGQQSGQQFGQQSEQPGSEQSQTSTEPTGGESESGFVGSAGDQSSDYLTKGENEDFQPEGQGGDTSTGTADVETGQPTSIDSTLDDGSDTSR